MFTRGNALAGNGALCWMRGTPGKGKGLRLFNQAVRKGGRCGVFEGHVVEGA